MKFSTKTIHAGQEPDSATGAVMPPVYLTSTFVHEELGKNKGFTYSRVGYITKPQDGVNTLASGGTNSATKTV